MMIIRNPVSTLGSAARHAVLASRCATVAGIVLFAMLTAAGARVQVPLIPIPITLQTVAVLLAGALLGPLAGAASQFLYLGLGVAGFPVFAFGTAGPAYLLGPTGGYLMSFPLAAFCVGRCAGPGGRTLGRLVLWLAVGSSITLASGASWMALAHGLEWSAAVGTGVLPFIPAALVKIMIVIFTVKLIEGGGLQRRMSGVGGIPLQHRN